MVGHVLWVRLVICCMFEGEFSGRLCSFSSMMRHRGSRSPVICQSHVCGIGLCAMIRAYIWWCNVCFESVGLCRCRWVSFWLSVLGVSYVRCGENRFSKCAYHVLSVVVLGMKYCFCLLVYSWGRFLVMCESGPGLYVSALEDVCGVLPCVVLCDFGFWDFEV